MEVVNKTFKQAEGTVRPLVTPNGSVVFRTSCCGKIHQQQSAPVVKIERTKLESVYIRNILKRKQASNYGPGNPLQMPFSKKTQEIHRRVQATRTTASHRTGNFTELAM